MPDDTSKVNLLIQLGEYYCSRDAEKALRYLQESLVLSTELNYRKGIANSLFFQGRTYYYKDEYEMASRYLERAQNIFKDMGDQEGMAYYHFATGSIHSINGNHREAINDFQEVIRLGELSGDPDLQSIGYFSLGNLHIKRSDPLLAMKYLRKSLSLKEQIGDQGGLSIVYSNIGEAYQIQEMYDSSLVFFQKGLRIRTELGVERGIASSEYSIGSLLIKMGRYQEASEILRSSKKRFQALKDDTGITITMLKLAEAMNFLGEREGAFKEAEQAMQLAKKIKNPSLISDVYAILASMEAHNGQFKAAYEYQILHNHLDDSLANANRERVIREMEMKFQSVQKDDKIQLLKSQNEIQYRNILLLIVSIVALVIIIVMILILFRLKSAGMARQRKLMEQENVIMKQENELKLKEQELMREQLEAGNRALASKALEMLRMNETIENIIEQLDSCTHDNHDNEKLTAHLRGIITGLETQLKNNAWIEFEKIFNNIHSEFFQKLVSICSDLTPSEIKMAALLKLNLNTKEISAIAFKSEAGIKSTRYRLRKKLGLASDENLISFLMQL